MALPLYLAMTAAEMRMQTSLPPQFAYMACHFSPYGTGSSNLPSSLPPGSILILNDRTPICGHDPELIADQLRLILEECNCSRILLDLERPGYEEAHALARHLREVLPCPVGVSLPYGEGLDCPLFLPPVPLDVPLGPYLEPWKGREVWLETAMDAVEITLTEQGAEQAPLPFCEAFPNAHKDGALHCHYRIEAESSRARFTLYRTREDVDDILEEAGSLGVTLAVGLWQELSSGESYCLDARSTNPGARDTIDPSNMFGY